MGEFDNIKHAYIGTTNIKSIYKGSELQWREPSGGRTVWRAVRSTVDDTLKNGDRLLVVLGGNRYVMSNYNTTLFGVSYIEYNTANNRSLKTWSYSYETFGSDGRRLCDYVENQDWFDSLSFEFTGTDQNGGTLKLPNSSTYLIKLTKSILGTTANTMVMGYSITDNLFKRQVEAGYSEDNLQNGDHWYSTKLYVNELWGVNGSPSTAAGKKYVSFSLLRELSGGVLLFKKVTAQI